LRLNIFLLEEGIKREEVISGIDGWVDVAPIARHIDFKGEILYQRTPRNPPLWEKFLRSGTDRDLGSLSGQQASCMILLEKRGRVFAIPFGSARSFVDKMRVVPRFGMIAALNAVSPDSISTAEKAEFDALQGDHRRAIPHGKGIKNHGLRPHRELAGAITGLAEDPSFACALAGRDSLIIDAPIEFEQLGNTCKRALIHFESNLYRQRYGVRFDWIESFNPVADPRLLGALDDMLVADLKRGKPTNAVLTSPFYSSDPDAVSRCVYRYPQQENRSNHYPSLRIEEAFMHVDPRKITLKNLREWKIREYIAGEATNPKSFSIYEGLIFETEHVDNYYVLSLGNWYSVASDHVSELNRRIEALPQECGPDLPKAKPGEDEPDYNRRAADSSKGRLALLDRKLIHIRRRGEIGKMEVCDLLAIDRKFIHVKRGTKADHLSHLAMQGIISAQEFIRSDEFRSHACKVCPSTHSFIFGGKPAAIEHTVIFGIITEKDGDIHKALPFFGKQILLFAADVLEEMGFRFCLEKIEVSDGEHHSALEKLADAGGVETDERAQTGDGTGTV